MEDVFKSLLSVEEQILQKMKEDDRSVYWLARKIGRSQTYCYRMLQAKNHRKLPITQQFLDEVNKAFPDCNFTLNPQSKNE